jgi:hypothetical protein
VHKLTLASVGKLCDGAGDKWEDQKIGEAQALPEKVGAALQSGVKLGDGCFWHDGATTAKRAILAHS